MLESLQQDGVRLTELHSPVTKAKGSAKSAYHPSLGQVGTRWVASSHLVYIVVVWNCLMFTVIPISWMFCWISAAILGLGSVWSMTMSTFLQASASHMPSLLVSYFDWA